MKDKHYSYYKWNINIVYQPLLWNTVKYDVPTLSVKHS